jgi:AraC-like DNA-binding protein
MPVFESHQRLTRYQLFSSDRAEEAHAFLTGKNFRVDFPTRATTAASNLNIVNGAYLPNLHIGHYCYARPISLKATPARTDYWFQFPTHSHFTIDVGRQSLRCDASTGAVLSPQHETLIRTEAHCARLAVSMPRDPVLRTLTALLDKTPTAPLEFTPCIDLTRGYGRSFARHVLAAVDDLEQESSLTSHPLALNSFEQFMLMSLLLLQPHNYSEALSAPVPAVASRDVTRAIDFIEAHLTEPITVVDIIQAAGVSGRALFKHFRRSIGSTPMRYLRDARLERVRQSLLNATPGEHVRDIAARWGFDHMGRFAHDYRRRFGESPSATLGRSFIR